MIITCTSCLTKFNLDDSRIPARGAKVRCSRCRHVFHVPPSLETKERAPYSDDHEELTASGLREPRLPLRTEEERAIESVISEKARPVEYETKEKEESEKKQLIRGKAFTAKKTVRKERKGPSLLFMLVVFVVLLLFAAFYLLTALGSGGDLFSSLQTPIRKIAEFIQQIF